MTAKSGYVHPLVHVNRVDRDEPLCGCHDDPWALCPRWVEWGVTAEEHAAAEVRAEQAMAFLRADAERRLPALPASNS